MVTKLFQDTEKELENKWQTCIRSVTNNWKKDFNPIWLGGDFIKIMIITRSRKALTFTKYTYIFKIVGGTPLRPRENEVYKSN